MLEKEGSTALELLEGLVGELGSRFGWLSAGLAVREAAQLLVCFFDLVLELRCERFVLGLQYTLPIFLV